MPIRATKYAFRYPHPDVIERGVDQVLFVEARYGGAISAPTATGSTCTVYDGNNDVVKTGAITVSDSLATFTLLAADTSSLDLNAKWRVEWSLVMADTRTYTTRNPAALVLRKLYPVLTDEDLITGRYADLDRYNPTGADASWQEWRDSSWDEIQRMLFADQKRPWLITEPSAFLDAHRELTLARIFSMIGMTQRTSDRDWLGLAAKHESNFKGIWKTNISFDYDLGTEDGASTVRRSARPILVLGAVGADYRR